MTDLVAYFFRRSFDCSATQRHLGLIATKTIAQGDTRQVDFAGSASTAEQIYAPESESRGPAARL